MCSSFLGCLWYGSGQQRYYQCDESGRWTFYVDKLYEQKSSTLHKLYLGDYGVFTVDVTSGQNSGITYLHKDRLGSIVAMTDETGNPVQNADRGFDPFGKPREGNWGDSNGLDGAGDFGDLNRPDQTTRGFTGHEHLNNVAITHMNGRAYDYNLGRFLSVDPVIQFPANSQSLNPYSYLMNNPMAGLDPSGYVCVKTETLQDCLDRIDEGKHDDIVDEDGNVIGTISKGKGDNGKVAITTATGATGRVLNNAALGAAQDELGSVQVTFPPSDERGFFGKINSALFSQFSFDNLAAECLKVNPECGSIQDPKLEFEIALLTLSLAGAPAEAVSAFLTASIAKGSQAGTKVAENISVNAAIVTRATAQLTQPGGKKLAQQIARFRAAGGTGGRTEFIQHATELAARARETGSFVTGTVGRGPQAIPNATIFREGRTFLVVDEAGVIRSFVPNASQGGIVDEFVRLGGSL